MEYTTITVERNFKVPAEKVFDAWLSIDMISKWMFGSTVRDEQIIELKNDPVVGGKFSFKVQRNDDTIDHIGTYLTIDRPHKLSFTWGIAGFTEEESTVNIIIKPSKDGCTLTLTHGVWKDYADRTKVGWSFMLDKLIVVFQNNNSNTQNSNSNPHTQDFGDKPLVEAQMLIRSPASEVFQAFIDPKITKNFWFTKGSDKLEQGKTITWEWEMYGVSSKVVVREIIPNQKIVIDWDEPSTRVVFNFKSLSEDTTYLVIQQSGLHASGDELLAQVKDLTGGFTTVVDGLKAYLEHGIKLNLIADKFPK